MVVKPEMVRLKDIVGDQQPEYCNQCGKCSSGCPSSWFLDFSPRRIVVMTQLNMIVDLLKSDTIWMCAECLKCKERCPREVAPFDVIQALRNISIKLGLTFPLGYSQQLNSISKQGLIQQPQSVRTRKGERFNRESLGLPKLQKPSSMEKIAQNLKKIIQLEVSGS